MFPSYRKSHRRSQLTALQQDGQMIFSMWSIAGAVSDSEVTPVIDHGCLGLVIRVILSHWQRVEQLAPVYTWFNV